ncbi:hypothetical protein C482_19546 [Natrialba chahannaoensis JCM 10990]|uniref:Uncharacterized protein n=1 Tax=Natrialba chahannaoensis JCM 10990 TaxID=1227492 RepID=M0A4D8_9EURY|nr:hypothetical protein [Natrialba chahannaoensis]ELY93201.1 hypothetical protein C482_19546 [Natrialba chahannaoensis JCM 10990]
MATRPTLREYALSLDRFALCFAAGLLLMGHAALSFWEVTYTAADPSMPTITMGTGSTIYYTAVFVVGAVLAFVAVMTALYRVIRDATGAADPADVQPERN